MTTQIASAPEIELAGTLFAEGRANGIPASKDIYGWLVGSWDLEVEFYGRDVSRLGWKGEARFAWILDGWAIQDTWTLPRWGEGDTDPSKVKKSTGTSLRVWDAGRARWLVTWINPISGIRDELVGERVGEDLVQLGHHPDGTIIRWSFREITPTSFHWLGEALEADGKTWRLEAAFLGKKRVPGA